MFHSSYYRQVRSISFSSPAGSKLAHAILRCLLIKKIHQHTFIRIYTHTVQIPLWKKFLDNLQFLLIPIIETVLVFQKVFGSIRGTQKMLIIIFFLFRNPDLDWDLDLERSIPVPLVLWMPCKKRHLTETSCSQLLDGTVDMQHAGEC